jgi:hypothetical protein
MSKKKEIEAKERARRVLWGVDFIYNAKTEEFIDKMRKKYKIKLPFEYDFDEEQKELPEETVDKLMKEIRKFVRESLEPEGELEKLYLGMKTKLGERSIKEVYQRLGQEFLKASRKVPKKKLKKAIREVENPVSEIMRYREESVLEFILTGKVIPFAPQITEYLFESRLGKEEVIVLLASEFSDPDILAFRFKELFREKFGKRKKEPTKVLRDSRFYEMYKAGIKIKDIADIYMEENKEDFPAFGTKEWLKAKKRLEEEIKAAIRRFRRRYK